MVLGRDEKEVSPRRERWAAALDGEARFDARSYGLGAIFVAVAIALSFIVEHYLPLANISLVFLASVLATAMRGNVGAAVTSSAVSFLAYNFFLPRRNSP